MDLTEEQEAKLKRLIEQADTLDKVAKKEQAWTLVGSSLKAIALWVGAILAVMAASWEWIKSIVRAASP